MGITHKLDNYTYMKHFLSLIITVFSTAIGFSQTLEVDLGLNVNWASNNIGASTSNPLGNQFAWGETISKNDFTQDNYTLSYSDGGNSIEGTKYDVAYTSLGNGWRMPTENELLELCQKCSWDWTQSNGTFGYEVTGPSGASIFLPVNSNGKAIYWSGTLSRGLGRTAIGLELSDSKYFTWGTYKFFGGFIRPVCENPNYVASFDAPSEWQEAKYTGLLTAIYKENYDEAYAHANFLSSAGDKKASYLMSAMAMCGVGGAQNYESAISTLTELAKTGDKRAQYMLGGFGSLLKQREMLKMFLGDDAENNDNSFWYQMMSVDTTSQSFRDCLQWFFTPLEEVAYRDIMYYAGVFCINGQFGFQDMEQGLEWIQISAAKGCNDAIMLLEQLNSELENAEGSERIEFIE